MKRSEINASIREAEEFFHSQKFSLPEWAYFLPDTWSSKDKNDCAEIGTNFLGWDITDFGKGDFKNEGLTLFTLRNGNMLLDDKTYCEKIMMVKVKQKTPLHFHWNKMEDIINRGGGNVLITVYNSTEDGQFADTDVTVHSDGRTYTVPAGTRVRLTPGESITIQPYLYHDFHVEEGTGAVLLGEVSMCNDDENDNRFYESVGRFPTIEEDEPAYRLLCNEYPKAEK